MERDFVVAVVTFFCFRHKRMQKGNNNTKTKAVLICGTLYKPLQSYNEYVSIC